MSRFCTLSNGIEWSSLSDGELKAIEAFALDAQQRLDAAKFNWGIRWGNEPVTRY